MESAPLMLALRGTQGIQLSYAKPDLPSVEFFANLNLKVDSRFMLFSPHGRFLVYHTPTGVQLADIETKEVLDLGPGTVLVRDAAFSPLESYLVLWDAPAKKEDNSCTVYDLRSRTVKAVYSQTENFWKVRWSHDEHLIFLMGKDKTYVFDHTDFNSPVCELNGRTGEVSVSPLSKPSYHVIVFNPGKGTPSFVRLYRYPNIHDPAQALVSRSVMKEDQVIFKWASSGTHVLFLASADMDAKSYYGSSQLFLMNTACDSMIVGLDAEGPVHAWDWNPTGDTFTVIYGFMPGKICMFNKKGDKVHTFESQYRNGLLYNPFGNILLLYGHGNIRGMLEIWDMIRMRKISSLEAEYMTHVEWSPDGTTLLCGTTSPRLKVGNKHRLVHYSGKVLSDQPYTGELYQINFRPAPVGKYPAPDPSKDLGTNYVVNEVKKAAAYVPPSMRNRMNGTVGSAPAEGITVHAAAQHLAGGGAARLAQAPPRVPVGVIGLEPAEPAKKPKKKKKAKAETGDKTADAAAEVDDSEETPLSTGQSANAPASGKPGETKKLDQPWPRGQAPTGVFQQPGAGNEPKPPANGEKTPAKKAAKSQSVNGKLNSSDKAAEKPGSAKKSSEKKAASQGPPREPSPQPQPSDEENVFISTGDLERDKKIAKCNKKIQEIHQLKREQAAGKILEKNQIDKINRLDSVMKELEKLQLCAFVKKK